MQKAALAIKVPLIVRTRFLLARKLARAKYFAHFLFDGLI
jgi:hypothetical protein